MWDDRPLADMPNSSRVDDLESEVDELKATVTGLTEELVEAHERIRVLEEELEGETAAGTGKANKPISPADGDSTDDDGPDDEASDAGETDEEETDDIIVA